MIHSALKSTSHSFYRHLAHNKKSLLPGVNFTNLMAQIRWYSFFGAVLFHQQKYTQLHHYAQLNFCALRSTPWASKIGVKCWWNWPQMFQDYVGRCIQLFCDIFFTLSGPSGNHSCTLPSKIVENIKVRSTNNILHRKANFEIFGKILI